MANVTTSIDPRGVVTLTLNRPEKHNALDGATMSELDAALTSLSSDQRARVVVLTGAGASFCAGADIGHMRSMLDMTEEQNVADAWVLARLLRKLDEFELH
jgi:methylglutaconyl-CoA hydratase